MGQQQSTIDINDVSPPKKENAEKKAERDLHILSDEKQDGYYVCSCGYYLKSPHEHALHIECHLPNFQPIHPCGWPSKQLETVPYILHTQRGVIAKGHLQNSTFTSITLNPGFDVAKIRAVISKPLYTQPKIEGELAVFKYEQAVSVIAFNWKTWATISPNIPSELRPFQELQAKSGETLFPGGTEGDIFLFVKGSRADLCYEIMNLFIRDLGDEVHSYSTTQGFAYKPNQYGAKDLTGFIDGTRNPDHLLRALADETIIFPDDFENAQHHTGGSFMYAGKFVHNLKKFFSMSTEDKNSVIGRDITKEEPHHGYDQRMENPRLMDEGETKSSTGFHVARGFASMYRQAMPFRESDAEGLYFICFSRFLSEIDTALKRMSGHFEDDGSLDKLFQITQAITSGYYYVPSLLELNQLGDFAIPAPVSEFVNKEESQDANNKLKIFIEYCTNCGYKTIFLDNKRLIEAAVPGVQIIGNPQMPRLSAFEITTEDGFVIHSKLSHPDGRNNFPEVFPTKESILKALSTYLKLEEPLQVELPPAAIYVDKQTRVGVW